MKKGNFLAAIFGLLALAGLCFGVSYTTYTNIQATNDLLVGNDAVITNALTVSGASTLSGGISGATSITGNTDVTGTLASTGVLSSDASVTSPYVVFSSTFGISALTPSFIGQLALDDNYDVYVASGTDGPTQWIKVGTQ